MLRLVGEGVVWTFDRVGEGDACVCGCGFLVLATGSGGQEGWRNRAEEKLVWKNGLGLVVIAERVARAILVANSVGKFLGN